MGTTKIKEKIKYLSKSDKETRLVIELRKDIKELRKEIKSKANNLSEEDFDKLNNAINNLLIRLRSLRSLRSISLRKNNKDLNL